MVQVNQNGQSQNRMNVDDLNSLQRSAGQLGGPHQPPPNQNQMNHYYLGKQITQENLHFIQSNRALFLSGKIEMINPQRQTYFQMIKYNLFPHSSWYSLPFLLIYLCTIVFVVQVSLGFHNNTFLEKMGANASQLVKKGEVYRLIVSIFLHVNIIHLVARMLGVLLILAAIQYSFDLKRILTVFLLCGIIGNISIDLIIQNNQHVPMTIILLGCSNSLYDRDGFRLYFNKLQSFEDYRTNLQVKNNFNLSFRGSIFYLFQRTSQRCRLENSLFLHLQAGVWIYICLMASIQFQMLKKFQINLLSFVFCYVFRLLHYRFLNDKGSDPS